jgi:uncharacterized protein
LHAVETAEDAVRSLGFSLVRVRHLGDTARVEVDPDDVPRLLAQPMRTAVTEAVSSAGYQHVVLDERGYRRGGAALPIMKTS